MFHSAESICIELKGSRAFTAAIDGHRNQLSTSRIPFFWDDDQNRNLVSCRVRRR